MTQDKLLQAASILRTGYGEKTGEYPTHAVIRISREDYFKVLEALETPAAPADKCCAWGSEGCDHGYFERYAQAEVSIAKDGLAPMVQHAIDCCRAWEPGARLIGNVMAGDLEKMLTDYYSRITAEAIQSQVPSVDDAERKAAEKYFLMMCESMALDPDAACNPELRTIRALISGTAKKVGGVDGIVSR